MGRMGLMGRMGRTESARIPLFCHCALHFEHLSPKSIPWKKHRGKHKALHGKQGDWEAEIEIEHPSLGPLGLMGSLGLMGRLGLLKTVGTAEGVYDS